MFVRYFTNSVRNRPQKVVRVFNFLNVAASCLFHFFSPKLKHQSLGCLSLHLISLTLAHLSSLDCISQSFCSKSLSHSSLFPQSLPFSSSSFSDLPPTVATAAPHQLSSPSIFSLSSFLSFLIPFPLFSLFVAAYMCDYVCDYVCVSSLCVWGFVCETACVCVCV